MFARFASRYASRSAIVALGLAGVTGLSLLSPQAQCDADVNTNSAFLFIKPHALKGTPGAVQDLVKDALNNAGITVNGEGTYDAETIDEKQYIDTHYGAIASKAVVLKPSQLNVPAKGQAQFQKMFGISWDEALEQGLVYNAKDGAALLGVDGAGLEQKWRGLTRGKDLIKFGGGFYCGKVDGVFIMNGFYMSMRAAYCTPGEQIHWMTVSWPSEELSWEDFRGKVLGATNPSEAEEGSIRRAILENYEDLGLSSKPNTGNNGVHASASPLEAYCERANWLGAQANSDQFAQAAVSDVQHVDEFVLRDFCQDPQVSFQGGSPGSLFDLVEDKNTDEVLSILRKTTSVESYNFQKAKEQAAATAAEDSKQLLEAAMRSATDKSKALIKAGNMAAATKVLQSVKQASLDFRDLVNKNAPVAASEPATWYPSFYETVSSRLSSEDLAEDLAFASEIATAKLNAASGDDDDDDY